MKLGEWLLTKHSEHLRQLSILKARCDQCKQTYSSISDTIEQLALQKSALGEPPSGSDYADPTYLISLDYANEYEAEAMARERQMILLDGKIRTIQDYVDVFGIILNSLNKNDRWFVENHFVKGITVIDLKDERFPDGKINSKTTLHNIKNRLIDEVTEMCELMLFNPPDFNGEEK